MATNWETYPIKFEGGWRTDLGRLQHGLEAPGSATLIRNFEQSVDGGYARILGYTKFSPNDVDVSQSNPCIGVIVANETDALVRKGNKFYKGSGGTWTDVLTVTGGTSSRIFHDTFNFDGVEKIVVVDGVNNPAYYTTTTGTMAYDSGAPSDVTGSNIVRVFKNHIFFANKNLLSFTVPFDYDNWDTGSGAGVINVGNDITGLIVFRDQLIIFTRDSIQRLTGNSSTDFNLAPIASQSGCLCPHTVQEVGGDVMYLGPDGIRWLSATERNNDFGLERASSNIQNVITNVIGGNCNYATCPIRSKGQYRFFTYYPSVTKDVSQGFIATKRSDQSVINISWTEILGMKVYSVHSKQFRDRETILFTSDDGYIYKMEVGSTFDGRPIDFAFHTPYFPINDPRIRKTIYKHTLYLKTQADFELKCQLKFDYNISGSNQPLPFNVGSTTSTATYGYAIYGVDKYGTTVSDTFTDQTIGSGFVVSLQYEGRTNSIDFVLDHAILEFMVNERR